MPPSRKGRFSQLAVLAARGCALRLLADHPGLVGEALGAMQVRGCSCLLVNAQTRRVGNGSQRRSSEVVLVPENGQCDANGYGPPWQVSRGRACRNGILSFSILGVHPPWLNVPLPQNDTTASAASSFLKTLLAAARSEATADPQLAAEAAAACTGTCTAAAPGSQPPTVGGQPSSHWVALWRGALLAALYSGSEKLRSYVSVHALPVVLGLEPTAALELIRAALSDPRPEPVPGTSRVAAVVAVLKVSEDGRGRLAGTGYFGSTTGQAALIPSPRIRESRQHCCAHLGTSFIDIPCG